MPALSTDLYELTMAAAYFENGMQESATFELFVRSLPPNRNYLIVAGLEQALDYLANFRFTRDEIDFLREQPVFKNVSREFFEYLEPGQTLVFSGHISIEADLSPELLREKVASIVLAGKLDAPRPLIPLLQFLAAEKSGLIVPSDESDD